jgi:hypothetical protein
VSPDGATDQEDGDDDGGGGEAESEDGEETEGEGGEDYFQSLSKAVGLRVERVCYINRGEGPASYAFTVHLASGAKVPIMGIASLRNLKGWKNLRVMEPHDQLPALGRGEAAWDELISKILLYATDTSVDEDSDEFKMLLSIQHFLLSVRFPKMDGKSRVEAEAFASTGNPFMQGGVIYVGAEVFKRWYGLNAGRLDDALFSRALLESGFQRKRMFAGRRWWFIEYKKFLIKIGVDSGETKEGSGSPGTQGNGHQSAGLPASGSEGDHAEDGGVPDEDQGGSGEGAFLGNYQPN